MVKVELRVAKKVDEKEALFVSFPFSLESVEKVKSLPVRYYTPDSKEWEVPVSELPTVLEMFAGAPMTLKGKVETYLETIEADPVVEGPYQFKTTPFRHQVEGFNYAKANPKFLLGDEQGLGKTKQAIDIAVSRKHLFRHCLIVCGVNSLKFNWMKEIGIHSNEQGRIIGSQVVKGRIREGSTKDRLDDLNRELSEFFLITNIETLRNKEIQERLEELTKSGVIGMVVIDEVHKCKNPQSQQGKAIHSLKARYKIAATGTPLMNHPLDLYNTMKWIGAEKNSFYSFRNRYCVMGGYGGKEVVGFRNMSELRSRFEGIMLRRRKDEVLNLPPKIRSVEYVEMTPGQERLYKEVKNSIEANLDEIELSPNPLAQLIRLRQVTAHTSILSSTISESAKVERLKEIVEELAANGQKAIVFSNWEDVTSLVKEALAEYSPAYITGSVKDRQAEVERFQADPTCKVIIGTIGAMGTGLTLTAASTVIFMDKPWNMANTEQAEDRAHRIGTTGTVNVITMVCKGTIDERIESIIEEKAGMADALVDGKLDKFTARELIKDLLS